jgi:hypothetical protein
LGVEKEVGAWRCAPKETTRLEGHKDLATLGPATKGTIGHAFGMGSPRLLGVATGHNDIILNNDTAHSGIR